ERADTAGGDVDVIGRRGDCETLRVRLDFDAVGIGLPAAAVQVLGDERVLAVGGEGVIDSPFFEVVVILAGQRLACGIKQSQYQVGGTAALAGGAAEEEPL